MPEFKIGDKVSGFTNHAEYFGGHKRGLPMFEGAVLRIGNPEWDTMEIQTNQGTKWVFVSTALLLSTPLPLPAPIDWSKPVRLRGCPDAKWRVLCTDAPGDCPVRVMLTEGAVNFTPVGCVLHSARDGRNGYAPSGDRPFENVPTAPKKAKRTAYMTKDGQIKTTTCLPKDVRGWSASKIIALCEVELTEGEGM